MVVGETVWTKYILGIAAIAGTATAIYYFKKSQALGKLTIDSSPAGAEIFLDDTDTGNMTPWIVELHPRDYQVTLKNPGYVDWSYTAHVNSGSEVTIKAILVPMTTPTP